MSEAILVDAPYIVRQQPQEAEEPGSILEQVGPCSYQRLQVHRQGNLFGDDGSAEKQAQHTLAPVRDNSRYGDAHPRKVGKVAVFGDRPTPAEDFPQVLTLRAVAFDVVVAIADVQLDDMAEPAWRHQGPVQLKDAVKTRESLCPSRVVRSDILVPLYPIDGSLHIDNSDIQ
jgi:hypothetical protein